PRARRFDRAAAGAAPAIQCLRRRSRSARARRRTRAAGTAVRVRVGRRRRRAGSIAARRSPPSSPESACDNRLAPDRSPEEPPSMRIAAAQINPVVGDFDGNAQRIIASAREAAASGARVLVTPELVLVGYPPEDLLFRTAFLDASQRALRAVCEATASLDLHLLVGHPAAGAAGRGNAASLVHRGRVLAEYHKHELPNYRVFDDVRYFSPGTEPLVFEVDGIRFGVLVCEDYWVADAPRRAVQAGAQVLLALNASPYETGKQDLRLDAARANVSTLGVALFAANLVGGQDELVFDGRSFALNADGRLAAQAP